MDSHPTLDKQLLKEIIATLARRAKSAQELHRILCLKGYSQEVSHHAVRWAQQQRWLDDTFLANTQAAHALRTGRGPRWLSARLQQRQISDTCQQETLAKLDEADLIQSAVAFLERRCARSGPKPHHKLLALLLRRGFTLDLASKILTLWQKTCNASAEIDHQS